MTTSSTRTAAPTTATANTSTSSLTLINSPISHHHQQQPFSAPPRTGTDSSTSTTATTTPPRRQNSASRAQFQATVSRASREERISDRQADLLRYKGTFTDSGRHSDDWLFGGWSFKDSVRGAWRWVGNGKGKE